jgi:transcriptional regulator with XRE-family HTH domain
MRTQKRTEHEIYSGKRLKRFRRKRNWTRDDLEYETVGEVTVSTLLRWETHGIPVNVNIKKLEQVCKALEITLEDLEKVETEYLQALTLDIVQERLETAADDMKGNEIVKIFEFIDKRKESEPETESDAQTYDPLKDLVEPDEQ